MTVDVIARIRTDLPDKFGVPRQSGLVPELGGTIVLEPPYRNPDALRGLEGFSHLWLIFQFHRAARAEWSPTVRPPRLGGNRRMGVFATRSPFRPNAIGLSCVILDIKPYLPYADCHPEATGGFTDPLSAQKLEVSCDPALLAGLAPRQREALLGVLACDPRPRYQNDPERVYGLSFAGKNVRFTVEKGVLTVLAVE